MKLKLDVVLEYDRDLMHGDDAAGWLWFIEDILRGGGLSLHSDEIGDSIGTVTVTKIRGEVK